MFCADEIFQQVQEVTGRISLSRGCLSKEFIDVRSYRIKAMGKVFGGTAKLFKNRINYSSADRFFVILKRFAELIFGSLELKVNEANYFSAGRISWLI
jgi:hypothetical protein